MRKKIILALSLVVSFSMLLFVGCNKEKEAEEEKKNVNITYVKAPLNVPSIIENNDGLFKKEFNKKGIEVNFREITSGPDQTAALAAGELDFLHALGGTSAILAASNGVDLKILNVYSRAPKGFMIMSKDDSINNIKDLKGKKIVGPKGTVLHELLISSLKEENMDIRDVEFIDMGIADSSSALDNGSADAALLAGPIALKEQKSGAKIIKDGEGLINGIVVTAVSGKVLEENPDLVKSFKKVHKEAVEYMKNNEDDVIEKTANEVGLTKKEVKEMYSWYDFNPEITNSDIEELENTQVFLMNNGMQKNKININDLVVKAEEY